MRASVEVVVERPLQVVWTWASDPRNWVNWLEGVHDVRIEGRLEQGSRISSRYDYGGRTHEFVYEVVERDAPRRQVVRALSGPFPFESSLELGEDTHGTRVRQTVDAGPDSTFTRVLFAVGGPLLRRSMRDRLRTQLERLKAAIELTGAR
jgi:Polyketide cyclase / dehydrase and lipid transport